MLLSLIKGLPGESYQHFEILDLCISKCSNFDQFYLILVKYNFAAHRNTKHHFSDNFLKWWKQQSDDQPIKLRESRAG